MCSNKKTLACIFDSHNQSIRSDAYKKSSDNINNKIPTSESHLNQIHIKFKNKYRLLTAIDEKTTFDDLKLALVISYYKKRLARSGQSEQAQLKKFQKNFDHLRKLANDDYVICETINDIEQIIDSAKFVREVLKRVNKQIVLSKTLNVSYSMRLKRSLHRLTSDASSKKKSSRSSKSMKDSQNLDEFFLDYNNDLTDEQMKSTGYDNLCQIYENDRNEIDSQLKCFDEIIQQRKNYIKLLEEYLSLSDELEADMKLMPSKQETLPIATIKINDSETDSSDTGFSSVSEDVSGSDSLSDRFNEWCTTRSVPAENRMYFKKISNFETYV